MLEALKINEIYRINYLVLFKIGFKKSETV